MKKAVLAAMLASVTIGAAAGGIATFSAAQEDTQLQVTDDGTAGENLQAEEENSGMLEELGKALANCKNAGN